MSGVPAILSSVVEKLLFSPVTITGVEQIGERFRLISMEGAGFKGVRWQPSHSVQIYLGNMNKRSYTPINLDAKLGRASFVCFLHGRGPGSAWAASANKGDLCRVMRPKDALELSDPTQAFLFTGDETSLATARALHGFLRINSASRFVFEVDSARATQAVLERLEITNASVIEKRPDGSHLRELGSRLAEGAATLGSPAWIFTGQAPSIQRIRKDLKQSGIAHAKGVTRAYWSPGKTGMD